MKNIALVGNPNSGKTTVFNALTGSNQHVGNWPGVTVEKKEGSIIHNSEKFNLVDLPGTYSLGAFSEDEVVARDYILEGNPDIIINVVDATNLERNLYLTTQLLEMGQKVVIALNMMDEVKEKNINIDIDQISKNLGIPIVETVASKRKGIKELIEVTSRTIDKDQNITQITYSDTIDTDIKTIKKILENYKIKYPIDWAAVKLLENDIVVSDYIKSNIDSNDYLKISEVVSKNPDYELEIVDSRYTFINDKVNNCIIKPKEENKSITDKIDSIVTNRFLGIPIFALIMFTIFKLTFDIGEDVFGAFIESSLESLALFVNSFLLSINAPKFLISFLSEGVIPGLAAVFEFIPIIIILYFFIGILEDTGYMARAAYIMDGLMRKLGLQGKAFIPMIIGFGCNVPGIMATRTLDNPKDKMIAILINPFMSCGAKIPIYTYFIAAFFPEHGAIVMFSLYFLGIIVALIVAKILSITKFKGESSEFIMELPTYRLPSLKSVLRNMWDKVWGFIKRAGTTIFAVVSLLWLLSVLPVGVEPNSQESILGQIGTFIAPIFKPAGFGNWQAAVSLFAGIVAKEAVVGTLGMVYSGASEGALLTTALQSAFTPLSAVSFMVMVLLYTPCAAVIGTVKSETNSTKWAIFTALYTFAIGWIASVLVFQIGTLLGFS